MTVAVRRALEKQTGLTLPPTLLWEHPTAAAVSGHLVELLAGVQRRPCSAQSSMPS
jgi:6-methylsalicylic acid synthase